MSLSTRFPHSQILTPRRHILGSLVLGVVLCSVAGGCANRLDGVATVIGVRNTLVESPRPPASPRADRRGGVTAKQSGDQRVKPSGQPPSVADAPLALGTSGVSPAEPPRDSSGGGRTEAATAEPGATSTSGQRQSGSAATLPGRSNPGRDSAAAKNPGLVRLVTVPLAIVAILTAVVVGRRFYR